MEIVPQDDARSSPRPTTHGLDAPTFLAQLVIRQLHTQGATRCLSAFPRGPSIEPEPSSSQAPSSPLPQPRFAFVASGASASSTASTPAAGTIHVYIVNTSLSPTAPSKILITGAFSDHGPGKHGVWHLTKGTITVNNAKLRAITSSPGFRTFYAASCSYSGAAKGKVPIVNGTGTYAGIKGSLTATVIEAEQASLLKNGNCNTSDAAPLLAADLIATATGNVSF